MSTAAFESVGDSGSDDQSTPAMGEIVRFIQSRNPDLEGDIDEDANLIEMRIVDSLDFVELLFIIEESAGVEIDLTTVDVTSFQSLRSMRQAFFG